MSFSSEVKEELARVVPRRRCCRKAELIGLFKSCGNLTLGQSGASVSITVENASIARKAFLYLKQLYGVQAQILVRRQRRLRATNVYVVRAQSNDLVASIADDLGLMQPESTLLQRVCDHDGPRCCARSYMRGLFLGAGSVTTPGKAHHLEMPASDTYSAGQIVELLGRFGIGARVSAKKTGPLVYLKQGQNIADFLNVLGAHSALMKFENMRAIKNVKSRVNRLVNMETANLTKVAKAASKQVLDIMLIDRSIGLDSLPEGLQEVARLRMEHPEATLEELGSMIRSAVTKSGVNHRMRRLSDIAAGLKQKTLTGEAD